jgi:putative Mg2+ transporter-C (MgtC) family protein
LLDLWDIVLRLGVAAAASAAVGLNRDLRGKPVGVRTLGLVGLSSALIVMFADPQIVGAGNVSDAASRVIQGVLTGIGFLGAGVIIHRNKPRVKGLTSAACVWFTACIGIVCGAGQWRLVAVALAIAFLLLLLGGPIERLMRRLLDVRPKPVDQGGPSPPRPQ